MNAPVDLSKITREDIKGFECVFATYSANQELRSDALVVKENIHLKDGRIVPRIRVIKDKEWPFWVTRKGFRNHQSQKEAEELSKLQQFKSTRINLPRAVSNALNMYTPKGTLQELSESPYLYGTDILPTSLIKHNYRKNFPDCINKEASVAGLDIETDVVWGTEEIIMVNITMKGKAYTAVTRKFCDDNPDFVEKCYKAAKRLLGTELEDAGIVWEIEIVDTPGQSVYETIQRAHAWKPDFISIWNMNFDIPKMRDTLLAEGYNLGDVFSDPAVPPEYRFFDYKPGPAIKKTQSGKETPIHFADRWHRCTCPASFYFLDSMCLYKRIRVAEGNEPSYSLNHILKVNDLEAKLKIEEVAQYEDDGDLWHYHMQKSYKPEYVVYNLIDDKRLIDLDAKTGDISRAFPALVAISDFSLFHKNPRRIADDLHFFYLERGRVFASTALTLGDDPLDAYIFDLRNWIVTLPSYMINNGKHIFKDAPELKTMIYTNLSDLDIAGTYPNEENAFNISKETTIIEACKIQGKTEAERRLLSLSMTGGKSNALEIAIRFMNYPTPTELHAAYIASKTVKTVTEETTPVENIIETKLAA